MLYGALYGFGTARRQATKARPVWATALGQLRPRRCDGTHDAATATLAYTSAATSDRAEMDGVGLFYREPAPPQSVAPPPRAQMAEVCWRSQVRALTS